MRPIRFSDFCEKEVINCKDGKILGMPVDLKIDGETCMVISFFVREPGRLCLSPKTDSIEIPWNRIDKIGDDIILVQLDCYPEKKDKKPKKEKKSFFSS